jgi:hypothetical protein
MKDLTKITVPITEEQALKMKELSTYLGSDEYSDRIAKVLLDDKKKMYYVDMQMDGRSELRGMTIHSERYAEDCAENFVMGYGDFDI